MAARLESSVVALNPCPCCDKPQPSLGFPGCTFSQKLRNPMGRTSQFRLNCTTTFATPQYTVIGLPLCTV